MLRFGVIGAGQISHASCDEINAHADAAVVAATDPNAERLKALTDKFRIAKSHSSNEALIDDPELDAIYIAVPNRFHAPLAIRALEAGKHVLLDKPFAMNSEEARAVAAAAAKSGKVFTLGMNQRFRSDSQKLRSLVENGALGDVYYAKAYWFRRSGIPKLGTWFGNKALAGGGALLDIGVHLLDLALYLLDDFRPVAVSGQTYGKFGHRGLGEGGWGFSERNTGVFDVDDAAVALIKLASGASVSLEVTWAIHQRDGQRMNVELFGSDAGAGCYPLELYRRSAEGEYHVITDVAASQRHPHNKRFFNFINAVLDREPLLVTIEQALAVQRILDAIYESSASGREVRFDAPALAAE